VPSSEQSFYVLDSAGIDTLTVRRSMRRSPSTHRQIKIHSVLCALCATIDENFVFLRGFFREELLLPLIVLVLVLEWL
jgi:hypothetical protein